MHSDPVRSAWPRIRTCRTRPAPAILDARRTRGILGTGPRADRYWVTAEQRASTVIGVGTPGLVTRDRPSSHGRMHEHPAVGCLSHRGLPFGSCDHRLAKQGTTCFTKPDDDEWDPRSTSAMRLPNRLHLPYDKHSALAIRRTQVPCSRRLPTRGAGRTTYADVWSAPGSHPDHEHRRLSACRHRGRVNPVLTEDNALGTTLTPHSNHQPLPEHARSTVEGA